MNYNCSLENINEYKGSSLLVLKDKNSDGKEIKIEIDQPVSIVLERMKEAVNGKRKHLYFTRDMRDIDITYLDNDNWVLDDEMNLYEFSCKIYTNINDRLAKIEHKAEQMDLTYFKDSDDKHCICDGDLIDRYDTLEDLEDYLDLLGG